MSSPSKLIYQPNNRELYNSSQSTLSYKLLHSALPLESISQCLNSLSSKIFSLHFLWISCQFINKIEISQIYNVNGFLQKINLVMCLGACQICGNHSTSHSKSISNSCSQNKFYDKSGKNLIQCIGQSLYFPAYQNVKICSKTAEGNIPQFNQDFSNSSSIIMRN